MATFRRALAVAAGLACGCADGTLPQPEVVDAAADPGEARKDEQSTARQRLRELEDAFLRDEDPSAQPPWSARSGPNPHLLTSRPGGFVGLLRGASALVSLDASGRELDRTTAPEGAVGWSWPRGDEVWIVGERSSVVESFRLSSSGWVPEQRWAVEGVAGLRDIVVSAEGIFVADRHRGRVLRLAPQRSVESKAARDVGEPRHLRIVESAECLGALSVDVREGVLIANCLLAHQVRLWPLDDAGGIQTPGITIEHDGPIWSVATRRGTGSQQLSVAVAGVEDHPLDRSRGGFGFIDSFVHVYEVSVTGRSALRRWTQNVSELGVVTPKWIAWQDDHLLVSGAGGHALALLDPSGQTPPRLREVPWGMTAVAGNFNTALGANPLLDGWVRLDPPTSAGATWHTAAVPASEGAAVPSASPLLGEALVFTTMMAPQGSSRAHASRFTCETCHFEGTVDGRTHSTGRGDVHATTKTLRGLIGNRPHFSRALDRNSMDMIHNEFRVANHGTAQAPWFSVDPADTPWFAWPTPHRRSPEALRAAVFSFLATLRPEPNPATLGRSRLTEPERSGARLFAQHCADCHAPLHQTDVSASALDPDGWEAAVLEGPRLVWASEPRVDVGVEPAVHQEGARTPSLRNLWAKRPYFTNGSAATLGEVLERVRLEPSFSHHGATAPGLSRQERDDLEAFIDLL